MDGIDPDDRRTEQSCPWTRRPARQLRSERMGSMSGGPRAPDVDIDNDEPVSQHPMRMPGQRDPDRTRRAILDAATDEFVKKGFAGASVNEIAERANVNKRMLYHYFGKKDELYVAVLERSYASLRTAQAELKLADLPPAKAIEALIRFTWDYYLENPEFLSLMASENMHQGKYAMRSQRIREVNVPLMELLKEVLDRGQRQGSLRANIDPLHLYLTIASLGSFYMCSRFTLSSLLGYDLNADAHMQTRLAHILDVVQRYLRP
jgi:AcrR family transcriptional regulator